MRNRFIGGVVGALACAGLLAACGGGEDGSTDGTTTTEALTKSEFIAQGDVICEEGDRELEAKGEAFIEENGVDTENPSSQEQEELVTEVFVPALQGQADRLRELPAPEGEEEEVDAIIAALESGIEAMEEDPQAAFQGTNPLAEASELATEYGFTACGQ